MADYKRYACVGGCHLDKIKTYSRIIKEIARTKEAGHKPTICILGGPSEFFLPHYFLVPTLYMDRQFMIIKPPVNPEVPADREYVIAPLHLAFEDKRFKPSLRFELLGGSYILYARQDSRS